MTPVFEIFDPIGSIFPLILNFSTTHFYKSLDPIGSIFFPCAIPGYRKFDEVPPPLPTGVTTQIYDPSSQQEVLSG